MNIAFSFDKPHGACIVSTTMARKAYLLALMVLSSVVLAPVQEQKSSLPVSVSPWVLHSKLTHEVIPEYPQFARENHIQGDVFVDIVVDENGKVETAWPVDCLNCPSVLGDAAVEAIKKWEYQPTLVKGKPARVSSWAAFRFRLESSPSVEILTKSEGSTPAAVPPGVARPKKLRISSGAAEANLVHKVQPAYSQEAKIAHIQGDVVMRCIIDKTGNVADLQVISGHPLLVQSALEAVKQWRYKPWILNGEPVELETTITVRFHM